MTLDRSARRELERPIESLDDLVAYFRSGEKPDPEWRVGTEHEKLGLYEAELAPVPFDGERGIAALLARIADVDDWKPIAEAGRLVALDRDGLSITLEPGGQLELSGRPLRTIHETCGELHEHLSLVRRVSEPFGIVWLGLGVQPLHGLDAIPRMPKERYHIMRSYLPTRGTLGLEMMHLTASVQASFDYADEADMADKLRTAMGVSPIVSALFANSSLAAGAPSGFVSKRLHIWRHTDPDRCGTLPFVFEPGFGYERYAEWALDVPMFFIVRDDGYHPMHGVSFRRFLRDGHEGQRATLADFDRHLTTLFPDVRLKRVLEVRGADAVPTRLLCSIPALWKGILYDAQARAAAWSLVQGWSFPERERVVDDVARHGLAARAADRPLLDLARDLVEIATDGLRRLGHRNASGQDESLFLDPVREQLAIGASPGAVLLGSWQREWQRAPRRLIEQVRY